MLVLGCLLWPPLLQAHNGEDAPPSPPAVPAKPTLEHLQPPRWSWLHWWEANREAHLRVIQQGRPGQKPDQGVIDGYREKAGKVLLQALRHPAVASRAAAALALGRIGYEPALPQLQQLIQEDPSDEVRIAGILAIGLLDTSEAETLLLSHRYMSTAQFTAGLGAMGLLTKPGPQVMPGLEKKVQLSSRTAVMVRPDRRDDEPAPNAAVGQAIMAAWALQRQNTPDSARVLQGVLKTHRNHYLAGQAILALGAQGDPMSIELLGEILLGTERGQALPAWQALLQKKKERWALYQKLMAPAANYPAAHRQYEEFHRRFYANTPNPPPPAPAATSMNTGPAVGMGLEDTYWTLLQASAAMALGQFDHPAARRKLLAALAQRDDEYSDLCKGMAIMALATHPSEEMMEPLVILVRERTPGRNPHLKTQEQLESPLRGYAAIALGLYLRPQATEQGPHDLPRVAEISNLLAQRIADPREKEELRAACLVALGLSQRDENLKLLQNLSTQLEESDLLIGYLLMARGMLADSGILGPAKKFLGVPQERVDTAGLLARRAAVLGLGILGCDEVIPILIDAWELNYYTNRETILALSLCQAYNVTDPLIELFEKFPNDTVFPAQCLGELFTRRRPAKLSAFLAGQNYMVRNVQMIPYETLSNEFLMSYLIPAFGDQWR